MKLLCYGASVTAQTRETGYFQQIENSGLKETFSTVERVVFRASHFEYAGYAFIQDVLDKRPDVCVIDWLTPSMNAFHEYKITLLNKALLSIGALPVWVFFPRVNSFEHVPEAYNQVKRSTENFDLPFIDLRDYMPDFIKHSDKYLRDAVHTTLDGAKLYSDVIEKTLNGMDVESALCKGRKSEGFQDAESDKHSVPLIQHISLSIDDKHSINVEVDFEGGLLEIFFEAEVGPHICYFNIEVLSDGDLVYDQKINPVDMWCHYKRKMILPTLRKKFKKGSYSIRLTKLAGNPFNNFTTRKPIQEEWKDGDRFIEFSRISVNTNSVRILGSH